MKKTQPYSFLEKTLQEANQLNFEMIASAAEGIIVYDRELRYLLWNPFMENLTGMAAPGVLGKKALDVFPHLKECGVDKLLEQALSGQTVYSSDIPFRISSTGKSGWVSALYAPHRDGSGKIVGVIGNVRDVTERRINEERLQALSERFWTAFNFGPNPSAITDMNSGEIIEANKAFLEWSGYTREEMIGRTTMDLGVWLCPEERDAVIEALKAKKAVAKKEVRLRNRRGECGSFLFSACRMMLEDETYVFSTAEDITGIKKTEETLRRSEEKYRMLFQSMRQGVFYQRADGVLMDVNDAALEMIGMSREEFLGRTSFCKEWKVIREDGSLLPASEHPSMKALETGSPVSDLTIGVYNPKTEDYVWMNVNAIPEYRAGETAPFQVAVTLHDITERKRAEESLKNSEMKLKSIVSAAPVVIGIAANRTIRWLNEHFQDVTGYLEEEVVGRDSRVLYGSAEEYERVGAQFYAQLRERNSAQMESQWRHKDGRLIDILLRGSSIVPGDLSGGIVFTALDITEHKQAVEALKKSESKFRSVTEQSPNMIFINLGGRVVYANQKCEEVMGYRTEDFYAPDFDFRSLIHPDDISLVQRNFLEHQQGRDVAPIEYRLLTRDGKILDTILTTELIDYQGQKAILGVITDITERKQTEMKLRESEERFQQVADNARELIWEVDEKGLYRYCSRSVETILGFTPGELIGKKHFYDLFAPDRREKLKAEAFAAFARQESFQNFSNPNLRKNGDTVILETRGGPLKDKDGKLTGYRGVDTDVTERERMLEELKTSEASLKMLFENMAEGVALHEMIFDGAGHPVDYRILNVNKQYEVNVGLDRERVLGRLATEAYGIGDPPLLDVYAKVVSTGLPVRFEFFFAPLQKYFDISASKWGETGFATIFTDVTERKEAVAALSESDERFRQMFDRMSSCVAVYEVLRNGEDFIFKGLNRRAEEIERIKKENTVGKSVLEVFPRIKEFGLFEIFQRVWRSGEPEIHPARFYRDDRISGWRENYVYKLPNGDIVVIYDDVTAKKRAEAERNLFFELSLDMIGVAGFDGFFKQLNPAWEKSLGWPVTELLSRPYLDFVHPEDRPATLETMKKLENGASVSDFQNRYQCRDGSFKWISWNTYPIVEEKLVIAAARDISERKRMEQTMRNLNQELEQRVVRRTAQLEGAVRELEAFTYSVSHDLRSPLRAISGFANALLEDFAPKLEPEAQRFLNLISSNASNMGALIDDLLALSRIGRYEVKFQNVDMRKLAEAALKEIESASSGRAFEWIVGDLPSCFGDPILIQQVWANLLSNAAKFTRLKERARIEIGANLEKGEKVYFVKDNGAGFDMQYASKLFKVFQRLHGPSEFEGSGVGLAIVHRIIYRHGGRAWGEGSVGHGACFYFSLPDAGKGKRDGTC